MVGNGDTLQFPEMKVETALARHSTLKPEVLQGLNKLFDLDAAPSTPQDLAAENAIEPKALSRPR